MKKTLAIFSIFIFSLAFAQNKEQTKSNPFLKLAPRFKKETKLKISLKKVDNLQFAHPQTLTRKQVNKIFHAVKIKGNPDILVLNNDEILKITKDFIHAFQTAKKNEMVILEKTSIYNDTKKTVKTPVEKREKLAFYFVDPSTLRVSYSFSGFEKARVLKEGFLVSHAKIKGKKYKTIIDIKKDLWTKYINKEIFPGEYEKTFEQLKLQNQPTPSPENTNKRDSLQNKTTQQTMSVEEMEKELKRLKDMLDKKLITQEEYEVLRKNILKKAGL